jgi:predicted transcriptional regulator
MRAFFRVSRDELALRSGISTRELTRIEAGQVTPTAHTLQEIDRGLSSILEARVQASLQERSES